MIKSVCEKERVCVCVCVCVCERRERETDRDILVLICELLKARLEDFWICRAPVHFFLSLLSQDTLKYSF